VAAPIDSIEAACRACDRRGRLRTDKLVREHGKAMQMPELPRAISGECPKLAAAEVHDRCDIHRPTLDALF
jgi:hypothetical protein